MASRKILTGSGAHRDLTLVQVLVLHFWILFVFLIFAKND